MIIKLPKNCNIRTDGTSGIPIVIGDNADVRWYAVLCHRSREAEAQRNLRMQGHKVYLPRLKESVSQGRRLFTSLKPFFPGYLFLQLNIRCQPWRHVNNTPGVRSLVFMGDFPVPVPRGLVECMISLTDPDDILDFTAGLNSGDRVRIIDGPFAQFVGTLQHMDGKGRIRVLVEIMNSSVPVTMDVRGVVSAA